jgi:hypothetical protein
MRRSPRASRLLTGALGLLLATTLVLRPVAYGIAPGSVAAFWTFVLLGIALPGVAVAWAGGLYRRDLPLLLGQGCALGFALQGLSFLVARALGADALAVALPFGVLAAAAVQARWRRPVDDPVGGGFAETPGRGPHLGLLLVALAGCWIQPLSTLHLLGDAIPADLLFHAGNAAELSHRWPPEDPRAAGLTLNYPLLAYALPAAASQAAGLPVADALNGLAPLFWIALFALQTYNAGRVLLGDRTAASLGVAVVLLHADPGALLGLGPGAFASHLPTGLYGSPSTACGLVLLASLAVVLAEGLAAPPRMRALVPLLFIFGIAASLTKATVVPVVVAGCGLAALRAWFARRRGPARAALLAAVLLAVAAAPFTLRLASGDASYRSILRWDPGAVVRQSPYGAWIARAAGGAERGAASAQPPAWLLPIVTAGWLAGYLGLGGVAAAAFLVRRRETLGEGPAWALGVAAAGAVPALLFDAHGLSQLFFLYNGQVLLGILAGGGLAAGLRGPAPFALRLVLGLAALPSLASGTRALLAQPALDSRAAARAPTGLEREYGAGLAWLRAHAARGAVVFADNPSLLLSAFGESRMFYETGLFTAQGWERRWAEVAEPFPERAALQETLLRRPDPEVARAVRRFFPPPAGILVVADNVQSRIVAGFVEVALGPVPARPLLPGPLFRPEFANRAMHVYRLLDPSPPGGRAP